MRRITTGVALVLAVIGVFLLRPRLLGFLDDRFCDLLVASAGRGQPSGHVAVVDIDDRSLAQFGRWPWPRDLLGRLAQRSLESGASAVVFDMMFPEPDSAHDEAFVTALAGTPSVVGYSLTFDANGARPPACPVSPLPLVVVASKTSPRDAFYQASGAVCSVPRIAAAAAAGGFLNAAPDGDGKLRRIPLIIEYRDRQYPSLALAAWSVVRHPSAIQVTADGRGGSRLRLDGQSIPLEDRGLMRLRFHGGGKTLPYVPAADVLSGIRSAELRGRIAVVGGSALGLESTSATPVDPLFPGVEVQATAIDNLLQGDVVNRPFDAAIWELGCALIVGIASALLLVKLRYVWAALSTVALGIGLWTGCVILISSARMLLSPLPGIAALACNLSVLTLVGFLQEKRRADRTKKELDSAQVTAREAIEESEHRYQRLVENVNDAIVVGDLEGRLVFANRRFCEWFGLDKAAIRGIALEDCIAPEWKGALRDAYQRRVRGEPVPDNIEFEGIRPDGTRIWIEALLATVEENGKVVGAQAALRDVTGRKRVEAQYLQAQKMESVGRLAGGVAHDFNNLLTVINGYSEILLKKTANEDPRREELEQIRIAGEHAKELTQKLLAFSRKQLVEPRALNLNHVVAEAERMFGRLIGEDIELITRLAPDLGEVMADPGQMHQVLMNLAVNARDAMPRGGKLIIEARNVVVDQEMTVRKPGLAPGSYVYLGITDTGTGMSPDVKQHLFEPFFTTKDLGRGTGLGLATVYGIVRQSSGWIGVTSELGRGTTFHLYLPRIEAAAASQPGAGVNAREMRGTETVLVVEDQDAVRGLITTVLQGYGYSVLEASDGPTAVRLAEFYPGPIHLLLTDVVLPLMNGRVLADQLVAARPDLKVLFISGYTQETISHHGVLDSGVTYLPKPFTPELLAAKIRETLGAGNTGDSSQTAQ